MSKKNNKTEVEKEVLNDNPPVIPAESETPEAPVELTPEVEKEVKGPGVMSVTSVTAEVIRSSATNPGKDPRLVDVKITYPEDYKGKKFFKDGATVSMSPESADVLIKKGIASKD